MSEWVVQVISTTVVVVILIIVLRLVLRRGRIARLLDHDSRRMLSRSLTLLVILGGGLMVLASNNPSIGDQLTQGVISFLPQAIAGSLILIGALILARLLGVLVSQILRDSAPVMASRVGKLITVLVTIIGSVLAADQFGVTTNVILLIIGSALAAVALAAALAFGLGSQPIARQVAAGATCRRPLSHRRIRRGGWCEWNHHLDRTRLHTSRRRWTVLGSPERALPRRTGEGHLDGLRCHPPTPPGTISVTSCIQLPTPTGEGRNIMRKLNVRNLIGLVIVLAMVTAACGAGADNADDSEVRFDTTATTEAPGAATYAGTEATTAARTAETSALNDGSVLDAQSYSGSEEATATRALSGDDYAQSGADAYEPEVEDPRRTCSPATTGPTRSCEPLTTACPRSLSMSTPAPTHWSATGSRPEKSRRRNWFVSRNS